MSRILKHQSTYRGYIINSRLELNKENLDSIINLLIQCKSIYKNPILVPYILFVEENFELSSISEKLKYYLKQKKLSYIMSVEQSSYQKNYYINQAHIHLYVIMDTDNPDLYFDCETGRITKLIKSLDCLVDKDFCLDGTPIKKGIGMPLRKGKLINNKYHHLKNELPDTIYRLSYAAKINDKSFNFMTRKFSTSEILKEFDNKDESEIKLTKRKGSIKMNQVVKSNLLTYKLSIDNELANNLLSVYVELNDVEQAKPLPYDHDCFINLYLYIVDETNRYLETLDFTNIESLKIHGIYHNSEYLDGILNQAIEEIKEDYALLTGVVEC